MEILAESTLWGGYLFFALVAGLITALFAVLTFIAAYDLIKNGLESGALPPLIIFAVLAIVVGLCASFGISAGPAVEYTALITDYNEVFSQGYEIVRQEGALTILTKSGGR